MPKCICIPQNSEKAIEWYTKLAEKGSPSAQYDLGKVYYNVEGKYQNYSKAIELFKKSADQGYALAYLELGSIYSNGRAVPQDTQKAKEYFKQACLGKQQIGCDSYELVIKLGY